jgi:hypothetical protein
MLSKSSMQLFERAQARFGLDVEVFDGNLAPMYPQVETPFRRALDQSGPLRQALADCLATGAPGQAAVEGVSYRLLRVRRASGNPRGVAMVFATHSRNGDPRLAGLWDEVAAAVLQTEADVAQTVSAKSDQSRRSLAMLRFLRSLADRDREADLARAVVQAAAVWYDVDARVYQRDLKGDFVLYTALPGAVIDDSAARLNSMWLDGTSEPQRIPPTVEWGQTSGSDVLLVPIAANGREAEWVLALVGNLPEDAVPQIATLGRIVGVHGELSRLRQRDRLRHRFSEMVHRSGVSPELVIQQVVGELVSALNALGGALTLNRRGRVRSLASVGAISPEFAAVAAPPGECMFAPDQFLCAMQLARDVTAILEVRPVPGDKFGTDAALTTRTFVDVVHPFLCGAEPALADPVAAREADAVRSVFLHRIEEELERAKRFDLHLSLVLIDMPLQAGIAESSQRVQEAVRRELRGSDVLGKMNGHRVAALLTHTDSKGSHRVVERLRRRLAEGTRLGGISIGHAVFSADCRTAEALVARAVRDAAPVAN